MQKLDKEIFKALLMFLAKTTNFKKNSILIHKEMKNILVEEWLRISKK